MQPGLAGAIELIEPGLHKLSNINRYPFVTAADVHERRHKLASVIGHLATFAPSLAATVHARPWEQLAEHPFGLVVCAVDTVEARWAIQARAPQGAIILDAGVLGLLYSVLRVAPGGWCLECKHPYDPELGLKQRAARWGQPLEAIRAWTAQDRPVDAAMIAGLAATQNRPAEEFSDLLGLAFCETPRLTECGTTSMQTVVPSQRPVLGVATFPVGAVLAAEVAKHHLFPEAALANWLAHDLLRSPARPRRVWRTARPDCPRHR
jgi:molybdopterin/thiamine biosynthesis adenylyltransferase